MHRRSERSGDESSPCRRTSVRISDGHVCRQRHYTCAVATSMQEATPPPRIPSFRSHPTGVPADAHRPLALVTAGRRGRGRGGVCWGKLLRLLHAICRDYCRRSFHSLGKLHVRAPDGLCGRCCIVCWSSNYCRLYRVHSTGFKPARDLAFGSDK